MSRNNIKNKIINDKNNTTIQEIEEQRKIIRSEEYDFLNEKFFTKYLKMGRKNNGFN